MRELLRTRITSGKRRSKAAIFLNAHPTENELRRRIRKLEGMVYGDVYENPHAESLNKTVKYKLINLSEFDSLVEADAIARYIEFYNVIKPHSSLG
jgi:hypothetical protein